MSGFDATMMQHALMLAKKGWGMTSPNPMVGAVIVRDEKIIGEGYHHKCGMPHAEVEALRNAQERGNNVEGATIYVTLEPCSSYGRTPPCTQAIIDAKIGCVFIGVLDPNAAHVGRAVDILESAGIAVTVGVEEDECRKLNAPFFHWITTRKPFVILKMATTLDGKIATQSGDSKWITGVDARQRVQELRRLADAIMVGGETVRCDKPQLLVREPADWSCQPRRLVASKSLNAKDLAQYISGEPTPEICEVGSVDKWNTLLTQLGKDGVMVLLIEGGGTLAALALEAEVVDYVEFHIAPKILGGADSRSAVAGSNPLKLAEAWELDEIEYKIYGRDMAIGGYCRKGGRNCLQD